MFKDPWRIGFKDDSIKNKRGRPELYIKQKQQLKKLDIPRQHLKFGLQKTLNLLQCQGVSNNKHPLILRCQTRHLILFLVALILERHFPFRFHRQFSPHCFLSKHGTRDNNRSRGKSIRIFVLKIKMRIFYVTIPIKTVKGTLKNSFSRFTK